jgi:esterase/lipase superfamily enzyme
MARNKSKRAGRVSWQLITLGVAGIAGATAVAPTVRNQFIIPEAAPQVAQLQTTAPSSTLTTEENRPSSVEFPRATESHLVDDNQSFIPEVAASLVDNSSPSDHSSNTPSLPDPIALDEETAPEASTTPPSLARKTAKFEDTAVYKTVRVFYATDRQIVDPYSMMLWARILLPALLGFVVSGITLLGVKYGKTKPVWVGGFTGAVLMTIVFLYHAGIYGQQTIRLARDGGILFGTRRLTIGNAYPLNVGFSEVTIPRIHQKGKVEQPTIFRLELSERKDRHVTIQKIQPATVDEYFDSMKSKIEDSASQSAMVFIHGYNVQFEDAVRRTAQIANDLEFDGAPIVYSWPSHGTLTSYSRDESNVAWTITHLEQFLMDVHEKTGVSQLHVIAHSMGNRALVGALERLALKHPDAQPMLGQVVLAAPDVDADEFRSRYAKAVATCSQQTTLYTSETDKALIASMTVHGYQRLGLSTKQTPTFAGIDTVDVSPVDTSLLGHSYYGSHPLLIKDLRALMELGQPPSLRSWLTNLNLAPNEMAWRFRTELASPQPAPIKR